MSDEPEDPDGKRRGWGWRAGIVVTVLALYVLSAGPASYLESHGFIPERTIPFLRWFYLPVAPLTYFETWRRYLNWFIWR
jgi:hypothetical protein